MRGKTPEEAKFFWTGGPVEVAPRTWFASQFSGCTAFETDEGLVLVDTGTKQFAPRLAEMLRQKTQAPVHTAIYTHGHIDHAYGLEAFLIPGQKKPRVIAHCAMPARFARYAGDRASQRSAQCAPVRRHGRSTIAGGLCRVRPAADPARHAL